MRPPLPTREHSPRRPPELSGVPGDFPTFRFTAQGRIGSIKEYKNNVVRVSVAAERIVQGRSDNYTATVKATVLMFVRVWFEYAGPLDESDPDAGADAEIRFQSFMGMPTEQI
jgi:hypothetical protein